MQPVEGEKHLAAFQRSPRRPFESAKEVIHERLSENRQLDRSREMKERRRAGRKHGHESFAA